MRILHTADWHLGKYLNQFSLYKVQEEILSQISGILKKEKIDVMILAGDIFQHYNPSDEAIKLFDEFLSKSVLENPQIVFIIISGNHDSSEKLNFGSKLFRENLKIISKLNLDSPIIIPYENQNISIYTLPFIRANEYRILYKNESELIPIQDTQQQYEDYLNRVYKKLNTRNFNIFVSHTSVETRNELRCDSEDDTYGTISTVKSNLFYKFDLVLLGHYHQFQKINKNIFYSGSIYQYSRKEANQKKGVTLFDIDSEHKNFTYEFIPLYASKNIKYIKGKISEIEKLPEDKSNYFYIEILDKHIIPNIKDRLSLLFPYIIEISFPEMDNYSDHSFSLIDVDHITEEDLFLEFLKYLYLENTTENLDEKIKEEFHMNSSEIIQLYKKLKNELLEDSH